MTGRENLEMVARLFGWSRRDARRRAADVLERLGLADAGDRLVRGWSGGMRRRLDLGATLVGEPAPAAARRADDRTRPGEPDRPVGGRPRPRGARHRRVLTTQYLDEADHLADRIVIIDHGRSIAEGTPAELKAQAGRDVIEARPRDRGDADAVACVLGSAGAEPAPHRRRHRASSRSASTTAPAGLAEVVRAPRRPAARRRRPRPARDRRSTRCSSPSPGRPPPTLNRRHHDRDHASPTAVPTAARTRLRGAAGLRRQHPRRRPAHARALHAHAATARRRHGAGRHVPAHLPLRLRRGDRRHRRHQLRRLPRTRLRRRPACCSPAWGLPRASPRTSSTASSTGCGRCRSHGHRSPPAGRWPRRRSSRGAPSSPLRSASRSASARPGSVADVVDRPRAVRRVRLRVHLAVHPDRTGRRARRRPRRGCRCWCSR